MSHRASMTLIGSALLIVGCMPSLPDHAPAERTTWLNQN